MGSNPTLSARSKQIRRRRTVLFPALVLLVLFWGTSLSLAGPGPIRLGIGNPVEEQILGHLSAAALEAAGFEVETHSGLDPEVLRDRVLKGELDLFWDYTGRALIVFHQNPDRAVLRDPVQCYRTVSARDLKEGLIWGRMARGNNSYGLIMRADYAEQLKVGTISDLAARAKELYKTSRKKTVLGLEGTFRNRPDGFPALVAVYGFEFNSILASVISPGILLDSLRTKQTQAVVGPTIDGRIRRFKLRVLEEDKPLFPSYNPAPVWSQAAHESNPGAVSLMDRLAMRLNLEALNDLRFPVEIHGHKPAETAREWLKKIGLVR